MSAVLVAPDGADAIRKTLRHVHHQAGRERIEVILVAETGQGLAELKQEFPGFAALRIVECGAFQTMGEAKVAGVRAASADLVMFLEDHAYPAPGWAEALLEAWEGDR
ncbi:MAG TPA: glycosyltransferase, partial [Longimicrobiales bacterium]|nr:glycosyltransferase [Longimicrobiales bacterium]